MRCRRRSRYGHAGRASARRNRLVEAIFAWPGLGHLIERAISSRDYPVVQVMLLFSVGLFVAVQLITDLVNAWLDPRIRLGGHA